MSKLQPDTTIFPNARQQGRLAWSAFIWLAISLLLTWTTVAPASAQSSLICPLVGKGTHNGTNATSRHQPKLKLFGTDLGSATATAVIS